MSRLITSIASLKEMVNHAKYDILKAQIERKKKEALMAQAVALFHTKKMNPDTGKPMSMRKLCQLVSDDHYKKTLKTDTS